MGLFVQSLMRTRRWLMTDSTDSVVEGLMRIYGGSESVDVELVDVPALCEAEQHAFQQHEATIERGMRTYYEVGSALLQIREAKLYRASYNTFEEYVSQRWGMERSKAYRDISAAQVAQNLLPIGNIPSSESQTRLIARLEPEEQREVWQHVLERTEGKPTATAVAEVLHERGHAVPNSAKATYTEEGRDSDELWTPQDLVLKIETFLGRIDLDPCSNSLETPNIPAEAHYTKDMNGLNPQRIWAGKLFINPPYSKPAPWVNRLLDELSQEVEEALILLPVDSSTAWWASLRDYSVLLFDHRLQFVGATGSARFASALFYCGDRLDRFYHFFEGEGEIRQTLVPGLFRE
jgi:phage N-6-adenine-methyltransferase